MRKNISKTFAELAKKNEGAVVPFLTLGYPSVEEAVDLIFAMEEGGADLIEIGIAFSDPMADGKVIQEASQIALKNGITLKKSLETIGILRNKGLKTPLVLMGYTNPFLAFGLEKLAEEARKIGIDGLIVPDLSLKESESWRKIFEQKNISIIHFVSPKSSDNRIKQIAKSSSGFIYCLTVNGVTGERSELSNELDQVIKKVRKQTKTPLLAGFGISKPSHVKKVCESADGAIVASALLKGLKDLDKKERIAFTKNFVQELKTASLQTARENTSVD